MDGSSNDPFMRHQSNKRNFSTMAASHRDDSAGLPHDNHYDNEHASQRRRIIPQLPNPRTHYPGDGLDFRRPIMSSSAAASAYGRNASDRAHTVNVIDLTDEDGSQEQSQDVGSQGTSTASATASTRAHRLPRFGRNVIDIESSSEDEETHDLPNAPGNHYLALPNGGARPQYSSLRRPARPPSPPTDMEDVEFLEERPRPRIRLQSRQPTPAVRTGRQRSATPYPAALGETIDLTEDNDDDIVHLNTRQREGLNNDRPGSAATTFMEGLENRGRGYGHLGHIANMLREGGVNFGGRLVQRIQGMAGLNGELRAQQQAYDHYNHNHNHNQQHHQNQHHRHFHHVDRRRDPRPYDRHGSPRDTAPRHRRPQQIRIQQMPGIMDYGMTGFDLGLGGNQPATPKYAPPAPAETGFTRSPGEDEVVVCPNCGDELAMGDSEVKQEVWVIRACGHAYCGECVHNRSRPQNKKGKGKAPAVDDPSLPPPFRKCVVAGCGKQVSAKSMIHVYLGC